MDEEEVARPGGGRKRAGRSGVMVEGPARAFVGWRVNLLLESWSSMSMSSLGAVSCL